MTAGLDWVVTLEGCVCWAQSGPSCVPRTIEAPYVRLALDAVAVAAGFDRLTTLSLCGRHIPVAAVYAENLAALPGQALRSLRLHGSYLPEREILALVRALRHLRSLDLSGADVTESGFASLAAGFSGLETLRLGSASPSDPDHRFTPTLVVSRVPVWLQSLTGLTGLSLRGLDVGDEVADLACLPRIETLDLGETLISDAVSTALCGAPHLRHVRVDRTRLTDSGCAAIAAASNLVSFDASQTRAGPKTLAALGALLLEGLSLAATDYSDADAANLARLDGLRCLDVSNTQATSATVRALRALPRLSNLKMTGCRLDGQGLEACRDLPALTYLAASCVAPDWTSLGTFEPLKDLQAPLTDLVHIPQHLERLASQTSLPAGADLSTGERLESLFIGGNAAILAGLDSRAMPRLREFICQGADVSDAVLAALAARPAIEALYVSDNPFSTTGLEALRHAPYVHTLELRNIPLAGEAIGILTSLPHLHCLDVPGTGLTDRQVGGLAAAPNLQSLALDAGQITDVSMAALAGRDTLVELYVYGAGLTPGKVGFIAKLASLQELNLMDERLTDDLAEAIAALPALRLLRAYECDASAIRRLSHIRPKLRLFPPARPESGEIARTSEGRVPSRQMSWT